MTATREGSPNFYILYRHGFRPTVVEDKSVTGKLSSFFHHLAGRDLGRDNAGRFVASMLAASC